MEITASEIVNKYITAQTKVVSSLNETTFYYICMFDILGFIEQIVFFNYSPK